jgi:hypothetical protein
MARVMWRWRLKARKGYDLVGVQFAAKCQKSSQSSPSGELEFLVAGDYPGSGTMIESSNPFLYGRRWSRDRKCVFVEESLKSQAIKGLALYPFRHFAGLHGSLAAPQQVSPAAREDEYKEQYEENRKYQCSENEQIQQYECRMRRIGHYSDETCAMLKKPFHVFDSRELEPLATLVAPCMIPRKL